MLGTRPHAPGILMLWASWHGRCAPSWMGRGTVGGKGRSRRQTPLISLRPCAMVVPDFELICEIMLVAEGFLEARLLARKFITLYALCKELLSKQVCISGVWGLRSGAGGCLPGWPGEASVCPQRHAGFGPDCP